MDKLFKTFSQVDGSYTRKYGGTGLGLVISKQLIEMMGGEIDVISEKGKGSIFSFSLKFEIIMEDLANKVKSFIGKKYKTESGAHILLVEDNKVNQKVIGKMLIEMGYSLDIAENGYNALEMIDKKIYNVCLMDIQMPDMDGVQTTFRIRELEKNSGKHILIIALTAYAFSGDREKFINLGMDDYISKPIKMEELFDLIEISLNKSHNKTPESILKDLILKQDGGPKAVSDYIEGDMEKTAYIMKEINETVYELQEAINFRDLRLIEDTAHRIKSHASEIGEYELKTFAFRIELAARRGDFMDITKIIKTRRRNVL